MKDAGQDGRAAARGGPSGNASPAYCLDCGEPLRGRFCSRCGQEAAPLRIPLSRLLAQALDDALSLDSRAWTTLRRLIARPGFLTLEDWNGRRTRYVPPVRLYLLLSFLSFLTLIPLQRLENGRSGRDGGFIQVGIQGGSDEEIAETVAALREAAEQSGGATRFLLERVAIPVVEDVPGAQRAYAQRLPAIAFALVPVLALELTVLFRRRARYFVQHLVTALHLQSFFFVVLPAATLLGLLTTEGLGEIALVTAVGLYTYRALRTVYWEQSRAAVLAKLALQVVVHGLVLGLALLGTFVIVGLSLA